MPVARTHEYNASNTWAWRSAGSAVLLMVMLIVFVRLFSAPREQAEALCTDKREEAIMMIEQVCEDPRKRAKQVVDHCTRYRIRAETSVRWCTISTMLSDVSLYRAVGSIDPSITLYIIIFSFGSVMTCCGVATCCAGIHFVRRQQASMTLPSMNDHYEYEPAAHRPQIYAQRPVEIVYGYPNQNFRHRIGYNASGYQ